MAGTYTKKDFSSGLEQQTLLKESNSTLIVPSKNVPEPVSLSPGWEGTGKPNDELNFKGVTMDQVDFEVNPPKDRFNIILFIMILHGISALMPWNMFINAQEYYANYKLDEKYTGVKDIWYSENFIFAVGVLAQFPNFIFNWLNLFLSLGGNLSTRIVGGICMQIFVFVFTVVLAMVDTSSWYKLFFWLTMASILILNISNGIYQNSVFGMAAKLPGKYTAAVILGSNISGTFTSVINLITLYLSPTARTSAVYYFITALFVLLAAFDTYFALPINRFYRYHEYQYQMLLKKKNDINSKLSSESTKTPLWKVFKQCAVQGFNVWFVFFVTLTIFPAVQSNIKRTEGFFIEEKYYQSIMCFMTFNVTAMIGSFIASLVQWPSKKYVIIPILLRGLFIPLFLVCNYVPKSMESVGRTHVYITDDWIYFGLAVLMGLSSGYFSSLAMRYCATTVEPQYSSTAGMFGAAFLVTGVFTGILFSMVMPIIIKEFAKVA